jgi:hypothetical protein
MTSIIQLNHVEIEESLSVGGSLLSDKSCMNIEIEFAPYDVNMEVSLPDAFN